MNQLICHPLSRSPERSKNRKRQGVTLLFVLVVVTALSLAVYSFSRSSVTQLSGLRAQREYVVQRLIAESAIEMTLAECEASSQVPASTNNLNSSPDRYKAKIHPLEIGDGQLGVLAVVKDLSRTSEGFEFGTHNESAKLNLNALVSNKLGREQVIEKLLSTPGVSNSIAEGICDKLGVTTRRNRNGNRGSSTNAEEMIRSPRRLEDLSDLITVPGVTAALLFGEDQNRNGILDKNENDGSESLPPDNSDGILDRGWAGCWSVDAGESNFRPDGKPKVNLNQSDLVDLHDKIASEFGADIARFVVAWKTASPIYTDSGPISEEQAKKESAAEREATFEERVRMQLGGDLPTTPMPGTPSSNSNASGSASSSDSASSDSRSGILLKNGPGRRIKSPFDLVGCKVQVMIHGKDEVLVSPFANDPASIHRWLLEWEEKTTTVDGPVLEGRININQASKSTLKTIDGMTDAIAEAILKSRTSLNTTGSENQSIAWLLMRSIVTSAQLRQMAPQMTTGGSIQSGIAIGQVRSGKTAVAIQFTIDSRIRPARIVRHVELEPLPIDERLPDIH